MPTIFDMIYREYCRARLAEMRKQLLIPSASDESPEARSNSGDPADPDHRGTAWDEAAATMDTPTVRQPRLVTAPRGRRPARQPRSRGAS
jgi:hypothetical protein